MNRYRLQITSRHTSGWLTARLYAWKRRRKFWNISLGSSQWWTRSHSRRFFKQLYHTWLRGSPRIMLCRYPFVTSKKECKLLLSVYPWSKFFALFCRLWQILSLPTYQHLPYLLPFLWSIFLRDFQRWAPMSNFQISTLNFSNWFLAQCHYLLLKTNKCSR